MSAYPISGSYSYVTDKALDVAQNAALDRKHQPTALDFMESLNQALIADANRPLICHTVRDELLLYNIDAQGESAVFQLFETLSGKHIDRECFADELSGGQKVLLMLCLALNSPAQRIIFKDLPHALDDKRRELAQSLIRQSSKTILQETGSC